MVPLIMVHLWAKHVEPSRDPRTIEFDVGFRAWGLSFCIRAYAQFLLLIRLCFCYLLVILITLLPQMLNSHLSASATALSPALVAVKIQEPQHRKP